MIAVLAAATLAAAAQRPSPLCYRPDCNGLPPDKESGEIAVSDDGRYVAFASRAGNLCQSDFNGRWDVYWKDHRTGTLLCVSRPTGYRVESDGDSRRPRIAEDGRLVVFESTATNLTGGSLTTGTSQIYVTDVVSRTTRMVSVDAGGREGNGPSRRADLAAVGAATLVSGDLYVVFETAATNLLPGDRNSAVDVVRHHLPSRANEPVNVTAAGGQTALAAAAARVSRNGRYVAFHSRDRGIDPTKSSPFLDVFVRDMAHPSRTRRLSTARRGGDADGDSAEPAIAFAAPDGGMPFAGVRVAFESDATDLVLGDRNGVRDVFLAGVGVQTELVSYSDLGVQGDAASFAADLDHDGSRVVFASDAGNLVAYDGNGATDVFLRDRPRNRIDLSSRNALGGIGNGASYAPAIAANGSYTAFTTLADNLLLPGWTDGNGYADAVSRNEVLAGVVPYGEPGGCGSPARMGHFGGAPFRGAAGFAVAAAGLPPAAPGALALAFARRRGAPVAGVLVWVDLARAVVVPTVADAAGGVTVPLPVPARTGFGIEIYVQHFHAAPCLASADALALLVF